MKKTLLKLGCLLIATILALSTLVACFGGDEAEETQPGEVTTEATENAPVPDKDWGGREFSVLSVKQSFESNFEIVGEMNGGNVSSAVYARNNWIKDKYNVTIQEYGDANEDSLETLAQLVEGGDHDYDLVFLYRDDMATAIVSGYMKDLNTVEHLNFSNEWYNQSTLDSMKISGKLFHMVSDFSLIDKARTNVLFLNRDLATDNQIPDIVSMVRDGSWTVDKMLKYEQDVATPNGDGLMDFDAQWGLAAGGREVVSTFWGCLGNKVVSVNDNGNWEVNLTNDHSLKSIDALRQVFSPNVSFCENAFYDNADAINVFVGERCLFLSETLSAIEKVSPLADFSFTAIPYPKYDTNQTQYYTTNDNTFCATFGIPVCAESFEFSGFMVEALSWKSHTTTFPEYYNVVCKVQNSYDAVCAEMVDLVFDGLVFDFGLLYGQNIRGIRYCIEKSIFKGNDITADYATISENAENQIGQIFDSIDLYASEE